MNKVEQQLKNATQIAHSVLCYWSNIQGIYHYKNKSIITAKCLDRHHAFVLDIMEKSITHHIGDENGCASHMFVDYNSDFFNEIADRIICFIQRESSYLKGALWDEMNKLRNLQVRITKGALSRDVKHPYLGANCFSVRSTRGDKRAIIVSNELDRFVEVYQRGKLIDGAYYKSDSFVTDFIEQAFGVDEE